MKVKFVSVLLLLVLVFGDASAALAHHDLYYSFYRVNTQRYERITGNWSTVFTVFPLKPEFGQETIVMVTIKNMVTVEPFKGKVKWTMRHNGLFGSEELGSSIGEQLYEEQFPGDYGVKYIFNTRGENEIEVSFEIDGQKFKSSVPIEIKGMDTNQLVLGGAFGVLLITFGGVTFLKRRKQQNEESAAVE